MQLISIWTLKAPARPTQFTLVKDQVMRLAPCLAERMISVVSGNAWITIKGQDFTIVCGHQVSLPADRNVAIISALGCDKVVFEIRPR